MADTSLQDAINKAATELQSKIDGKSGDAVPDNTAAPEVEIDAEAETTEDGDEPESGDEPEFSETELDESKRLYQALKNPATRGPILAALAAQTGLSLTTTTPTKTEVKEAKKSIQDAVKDALGDGYKFLAPQLGKAIEDALAIQNQEHEASLQEIRQQQIERDVVTSYEKLARETKGESKKLETQMATLSEEVPIGNMTVEKYIRRLYSIATSEAQQSSARKTADKIRRNAGNAPERLRSGSQAGTEPRIPDEKMGLKESVEFALGELSKGR